MKVAVRYQSRGGNTKAVAEAIAKATGVSAETIDVPITEVVDVLFVGGGVYGWTIDSLLKIYLETLTPCAVKSVAAFSTGAAMKVTGKIAEIVKTKGIDVCKEKLPIKKGLQNYQVFGGKGDSTLSDKQLRLVKSFVEKIVG